MDEHDKCLKHEDKWVTMHDDEDDDGDMGSTSSSSSASFENSRTSNGSASYSSSDVVDDDDASSPTSISSSSTFNGVFELSELMAHLPIKRGLSNFYQGKSESFTSVSIVATIEQLQKKEIPYRRKRKATKSHGNGNGLDIYKSYTLPKAIISKKVSSRSRSCSCNFPGRRRSSFNGYRTPPAPKKF